MSRRIITLQRQARELGRLRAGLTASTVKNGRTITYPTSSKTWILTSSQRDYLDVAATLWGGAVEEWEPQGGGPKAWRLITEQAGIDAILPPGDPLSQSFELWSKGGCQRRCDGETEIRSDQACLCRAQFGEDFHTQKQGTVCDIHTRINVILPDLPDIGVWRVETKGYWAANRIAAAVDLIKAQVGSQILIPVRLRIDPRKKVDNGQTSQFTEIVVEIRGGITFGQVLAGQVPNLAVTAAERTAIGSGPTPAVQTTEPAAQPSKLTAELVLSMVKLCRNPEQLRDLWADAGNAGPDVLTDDVRKAFEQRGAALKNGNGAKATSEPESEPPTEVVDAEPEPDKAAAWMQILAYAGGAPLRWSTETLEAAVAKYCGRTAQECDGWELSTFLDALKNGRVS